MLKEINKKSYAHFVWPFLNPVDPKAMGIPQYRTLVPNPMDISTIAYKTKSTYVSADQFYADFKLMLQNCFLFNSAGTDVHGFGRNLESQFEDIWRGKDFFLSQHSKDESDSDDDDDDEDTQAINVLKSQISILTQQLQVLIEKRRRKKSRKALAVAAKPRTKPRLEKKTGDKRKKKSYDSDEEKMPEGDITYEQKRELSDNINILPSEKLPTVFDIIKENTLINVRES